MSSVASTILKKAFSMAGATFASRILGLVREILMAAVLGGGTLASVFERIRIVFIVNKDRIDKLAVVFAAQPEVFDLAFKFAQGYY